MNYMIAHFEEAATNMNLDIVKNGNKYYVELSKDMLYASRSYETIDEAFTKFSEMAECLVKGLYSNEKKIELLKA